MNNWCSRCGAETWHVGGACIPCFVKHHEADEQNRLRLQHQLTLSYPKYDKREDYER